MVNDRWTEDTVESLKEELRRIEEWEEDQRDLWFWEKLGRFPFALLDRMMPKVVHDRIGQGVGRVGKLHTDRRTVPDR